MARRVLLKNLGPALNAYIRALIPLVGMELAKEVARALWLQIGETSPVGHPERDPHPGKYQASHTPSFGSPQPRSLPDLPSYPRLGLPELDSKLDSWSPNISLHISTDAKSDDADSGYSASLEAGRRTKGGRTYGSPQAPGGIYGPAIRHVRGKRAILAANAIRRTKQKLL